MESWEVKTVRRAELLQEIRMMRFEMIPGNWQYMMLRGT